MSGSGGGTTSRPKVFVWTVLGAMLLPAALAAAPAQAHTLRLGGSGGAIATMKLLAEAFRKHHPDAKIVVVPSLGSSGGVKAVVAGAIDLAASSRPLKSAEQEHGAVGVEFGRSPLVFAVASRARDSAIATRELVAIYRGETATWPDGRPLRLVLRPKSESDTEALKNISAEMSAAVDAALAREGMIVSMTDQDNAERLEKIPGAIGTSTLVQMLTERRALKALKLDGVMPSPRALATGAYPHYKRFYFVTGPSSGPLARKFVEFAGSPAGRAILAQNGYWVAPQDKPRAEHPSE